VSPKEIEAVILEIPGVIDCKIYSVDDEIEGESLKASIVVRKDYNDALTGETIKQHCSKHLALFKIPKVCDIKIVSLFRHLKQNKKLINMKSRNVIFSISLMIILAISCGKEEKFTDMNIIYLHHSTGQVLWDGDNHSLKKFVKEYNKENKTDYTIREKIFPKSEPYGWNNYPFDYYNIWVKNAGEEPFMAEPTLEILTKDYQVIVFKHCFPVSNILADLDSADINSEIKTLSNYKLQYAALRDKLHEFPGTKFIIWTGAAQVKGHITEEEALRAKEFFGWVTDQWDLPDDNIYIWDLYSLQTEGGLYFKDEYAVSPQDPHPNDRFAEKTAKLLFNRIIDVINNNGNGTQVNGKGKNN